LDTELKFDVGYDQSENDIPFGTSLQYDGCKGPEEIKVPYNHDVITTVGSTHGWDALLRTLCDENDCNSFVIHIQHA
jgi:aromatic amino acid aminotransferase I